VRRGGAAAAAGSDDPAAAFQRALLYYEHPLSPWPAVLTEAAQRFGLPGSNGAKAGTKAKEDEALVATMLEDWTAAIASLFQQLRAGQCPCVMPTPSLALTSSSSAWQPDTPTSALKHIHARCATALPIDHNQANSCKDRGYTRTKG
jgi:hypothetical protein